MLSGPAFFLAALSFLMMTWVSQPTVCTVCPGTAVTLPQSVVALGLTDWALLATLIGCALWTAQVRLGRRQASILGAMGLASFLVGLVAGVLRVSSQLAFGVWVGLTAGPGLVSTTPAAWVLSEVALGVAGTVACLLALAAGRELATKDRLPQTNAVPE